MKLTGSYTADFAAANAEAGISVNTAPTGYVWHHLDDFNTTTGTATLQFIKVKVHRSTIPHTGSVM